MRRLLLAMTLTTLGCGASSDKNDALAQPRCSDDATKTVLAGRWAIRGTGTREACTEPSTNAKGFSLAADLVATQAPDGTLTLKPEAPPANSVFDVKTASVHGSCVTFTLVETLSAATVSTTFTGEVGSSGRVLGTFDVKGPGTCVGKGDFTLTLQ